MADDIDFVGGIETYYAISGCYVVVVVKILGIVAILAHRVVVEVPQFEVVSTAYAPFEACAINVDGKLWRSRKILL